MRLVVRLLGPLEVACGDRQVRIAAAKERLVLVLLALNAQRVVSTERLIDALWGEDPPESAGVSLRVLISRLRKAAPRPAATTRSTPGPRGTCSPAMRWTSTGTASRPWPPAGPRSSRPDRPAQRQ